MSSPCRKRRFVSHGGDVWGFSRKHDIPVEKVLDFSAPLNYLGASPKAVKAIRDAAKFVKFYPDPNPTDLKREIADYVGGVKPENIIIGNGSIEPIYMFAEFFAPNVEAIIPVPSFSEYEKAVLRVHATPVFANLTEDFSMKLDEIEQHVTDKTRIIFVCNPHSPSGTIYNREIILQLVDFCSKKKIYVCVDENYMEFTNLGQKTTVAGYIEEYTNLFVVKSLSKFFGMPGVRFGYAITNQNFVCELQDVRQPWSINLLAVFATKAALKDTEFIDKTRRSIAKEKANLIRQIGKIEGLHVFPSVTNFLLVKILGKKTSSIALREELAKEGLLIRDCSTFVGLDDSYFRITVRSSKENSILLRALKKHLK